LPFDCEYIIDGKVSGGGYINRHRRTMISRIDLFDQMVREITKMGINKHTSELEKRVLNAIDIFGLSDDATALEIRFLLCVIALEGLLLSEGDKDYLGWKLSEKVAFLVADTREWRVAQERYGRPHTN
jgi:transcriptional regulator CtsR